MAVRDFKGAATLFLEAVPTFGSYELLSYEQLVFYTVISCVLGMKGVIFLITDILFFSTRSS